MMYGQPLQEKLQKLASLNPPNLREATDKDQKSCESCQYFTGKAGRSHEGDGSCGVGRRDVPVRQDFLCDLWSGQHAE